MPTVPLFDPTAAAGAWHNVTAPGGYESWSFDADDPATDTQITVAFLSGAQLHTAYLREFGRYRRNPTQVAPPRPADHGGVAVCIYRGGKRLHRSFTPAKCLGAEEQIVIGQSRLTFAGDVFRLEVSVPGVSLDLTVTRAAASPTRRVLRGLKMSQHHVTLVSPRATFSGSITLGNEKLTFTGVGTHEYAFGTGPISYSVSRLIRGRVVTADTTAVFYLARHYAEKLGDEAVMLQTGPSGVIEIDKAVIAQPYVDRLSFGEHLVLTSPRVIDAHDRGQRIVFDAQLQGVSAKAHCDVLYPQAPQPSAAAAVLAWLD